MKLEKYCCKVSHDAMAAPNVTKFGVRLVSSSCHSSFARSKREVYFQADMEGAPVVIKFH